MSCPHSSSVPCIPSANIPHDQVFLAWDLCLRPHLASDFCTQTVTTAAPWEQPMPRCHNQLLKAATALSPDWPSSSMSSWGQQSYGAIRRAQQLSHGDLHPEWSLCQLTSSLSFSSVPAACFAHLSICPAHVGSQCFKQIFARQAALCSQQSIRWPNPPAGRRRGRGSSKYQPGTRRNQGNLVRVSRASQPPCTRANHHQAMSLSQAPSPYHFHPLPSRLPCFILTLCSQFCCFTVVSMV